MKTVHRSEKPASRLSFERTTTMLVVAASFASAVATACTTQPPPIESHGEVLESARLKQLRTFSFAPTSNAAPEGYEATERSPQVVAAMKPLVAALLAEKGWVEAPDGDGDLRVVCTAGRRGQLETKRVSPRTSMITGESTREREWVEGAIAIDAYDRRGVRVWHGYAHTEIDPDKPSSERLRRAVGDALHSFPARQFEAPPQGAP
jgi:hypothetical protein